MKQFWDLIIIGGGASGLTAAYAAASEGISVLLLERLPRVGKKLLLTGNGRCNFSNLQINKRCFFGSYRKAPLLCSEFDARDFFESLGVYARSDSAGRLYPYSNHASSILDALRFGCMEKGVVIREESQVQSVLPKNGQFSVQTAENSFQAHSVIFAAGGSAAPNCGTDGSAAAILRKLGIPTTKCRPSLAPLKTTPESVRALKGLRVQASVSLLKGTSCLAQDIGEVQFNDGMISGICVFQLSRFAENPPLTLSLNLLPDFTKNQATELIDSLIKTRKNYAAEDLLTGLFQKRVAQVILKQNGISYSEKVSCLPPHAVHLLASTITDWQFPVTGVGTWQSAQTTAGGVVGSELNDNMELLRIPGFYVVGEAVDVDGICGGYNLHWAWTSGAIAGRAAAHRLKGGY